MALTALTALVAQSPPSQYALRTAGSVGAVSTVRSGERLGLQGFVLRLVDGSGIE
jgi:hypothetical protein